MFLCFTFLACSLIRLLLPSSPLHLVVLYRYARFWFQESFLSVCASLDAFYGPPKRRDFSLDGGTRPAHIGAGPDRISCPDGPDGRFDQQPRHVPLRPRLHQTIQLRQVVL